MKLRLAALVLGVAITNPAQLFYTANGGVRRSFASRLSDTVKAILAPEAPPSLTEAPQK